MITSSMFAWFRCFLLYRTAISRAYSATARACAMTSGGQFALWSRWSASSGVIRDCWIIIDPYIYLSSLVEQKGCQWCEDIFEWNSVVDAASKKIFKR